jgi:Rod binding domain-containing protein
MNSAIIQLSSQRLASADVLAKDTPATLRLKKAASEFEALLLAKWWSSMKDSGIPGGHEQSDPGHDTLDEMGIQAMSTAVASQGGLGIGRMLVHSLLSNAEGGPKEGLKAAPFRPSGPIQP